jgi:hypothetical protein
VLRKRLACEASPPTSRAAEQPARDAEHQGPRTATVVPERERVVDVGQPREPDPSAASARASPARAPAGSSRRRPRSWARPSRRPRARARAGMAA